MGSICLPMMDDVGPIAAFHFRVVLLDFENSLLKIFIRNSKVCETHQKPENQNERSYLPPQEERGWVNSLLRDFRIPMVLTGNIFVSKILPRTRTHKIYKNPFSGLISHRRGAGLSESPVC